MIIKVDGKALEWRVAVELSGDKVGLAEILQGVDPHEDNRKLFKLPSRLIAKTFLFRLIYGGSAYSYSVDPEFTHVSTSQKFWQKVIDGSYEKYRGLAEWHKKIVQDVTRTGHIIIPSGREYVFLPERKRGELVWPRTKILNYPVQGFSADLVMIARILAYNRLKEERRKGEVIFFNTVHDDIELDVVKNPELWYNISISMEKVFEDVPRNVARLYGYEMKVPLKGEVSFGNNLKDMFEFDNSLGKEQFNVVL